MVLQVEFIIYRWLDSYSFCHVEHWTCEKMCLICEDNYLFQHQHTQTRFRFAYKQCESAPERRRGLRWWYANSLFSEYQRVGIFQALRIPTNLMRTVWLNNGNHTSVHPTHDNPLKCRSFFCDCNLPSTMMPMKKGIVFISIYLHCRHSWMVTWNFLKLGSLSHYHEDFGFRSLNTEKS